MITLIAAMANHGVIGFQGSIPFEEKADRLHFKQLTTRHVVVMGRVTFESIGKPLPNRVNVVLTKDPSWTAPGIILYRTADECLGSMKYLAQSRDVMIIGGSQVYSLFLPCADQMVITHVNAAVEGDTFFPKFEHAEWNSQVMSHHDADRDNQYPFVIRRYVRK